MKTALVLSPHLDDAAFSCGGTMALLADAGWRVCLATAFTRSVVPAVGFALDCQLDKGLGAEVDYMALRREEDRVAAEALGVGDLRWLDLLEAPHRGYGSAAELFGAVRGDDEVWRELVGVVGGLVRELAPDWVLAPQGLGGHVDHRQMIRAVRELAYGAPLAYYRDTPYAIREDGALPDAALLGLSEGQIRITAGLDRKVAAACAYASQVGFQFGGVEAAAAALRDFAVREGALGEEAGRDGLSLASERFLGEVPFPLH